MAKSYRGRLNDKRASNLGRKKIAVGDLKRGTKNRFVTLMRLRLRRQNRFGRFCDEDEGGMEINAVAEARLRFDQLESWPAFFFLFVVNHMDKVYDSFPYIQIKNQNL
jgi:hypothetical protein